MNPANGIPWDPPRSWIDSLFDHIQASFFLRIIYRLYKLTLHLVTGRSELVRICTPDKTTRTTQATSDQEDDIPLVGKRNSAIAMHVVLADDGEPVAVSAGTVFRVERSLRFSRLLNREYSFLVPYTAKSMEQSNQENVSEDVQLKIVFTAILRKKRFPKNAHPSSFVIPLLYSSLRLS